jgi:hypothetical protein
LARPAAREALYAMERMVEGSRLNVNVRVGLCMKPREEWTEDWRANVDPAREGKLGRDLLTVFREFWESENLSAASKSTRNRYSGSLYALGGYLVARGIEVDHGLKSAHELLIEAIDLDEGPLIHFDNEAWQAELDTTCRRLYRYLMSRAR